MKHQDTKSTKTTAARLSSVGIMMHSICAAVSLTCLALWGASYFGTWALDIGPLGIVSQRGWVIVFTPTHHDAPELIPIPYLLVLFACVAGWMGVFVFCRPYRPASKRGFDVVENDRKE